MYAMNAIMPYELWKKYSIRKAIFITSYPRN